MKTRFKTGEYPAGVYHVEEDETVTERTREFLLEDESVGVDREAVEVSICEEFLRDHVAFKVFHEEDNVHVEADVVEPGQLPLTDDGKPQRLQLISADD